jgi:hypothetical protein
MTVVAAYKQTLEGSGLRTCPAFGHNRCDVTGEAGLPAGKKAGLKIA